MRLRSGVHDRPFRRRRELLEHLCAEPLDVLDGEAPKTAAGEADGAEDAALLPVTDGVLVHSQHPCGVANVQEFLRRRHSPSIPPDVIFVEYVDFSPLPVIGKPPPFLK